MVGKNTQMMSEKAMKGDLIRVRMRHAYRGPRVLIKGSLRLQASYNSCVGGNEELMK